MRIRFPGKGADLPLHTADDIPKRQVRMGGKAHDMDKARRRDIA